MCETDRSVDGIVFNIQKYSVNDGPGIRTVVFLKGCPLRCGWCANPESQLRNAQILRDGKKCIKCGHCSQVCPEGAMSMQAEEPVCNPAKCNACGRCAQECPARALQIEGKRMTVDEVLSEVRKDRVFYEESGGGMTLSGGEMLAQPAFSLALLKAAKAEGLQTCAETTGYGKEEDFARILSYLDVLYIDVKHWDPARHKEGTGVTNTLPVRNLQTALRSGKEVLPRIPVIPGFNDTLDDARKLAGILKQVNAPRCQLLPFHQFGENKYDLLGRDYAYRDIGALHREELENYRQEFAASGIDAFF